MEEVKVVTDELEEFDYTEFDSNLFNKLFNLDVAPYVDSIQTKKANLKYLSWATAYQLLMHYDPKADVKVETDADGFPLFSRGNLHFVKTSITASDERIVVTAKIRRDSVNLADVDAPAADGRAHDFQLAARHTGQPQHGCVGMRPAQVDRADFEVQSDLFGDGEAARDAVVVGLHPQKARHQRFVGTVAAPGGGKAAVEQNLCVGGLLAQQTPRRAANAHRARRMAAGRPGHDRAQHIK